MPIILKIKSYFLNFIQTQLIVTIVTIPILVGWGLSLSLMSFVGNLIFAPILTIFLMLSSMIFFTELLCIPNSWLILCLEQFTQSWDNVLSCGQSRWLIEFYNPPTLILVAIPIVTFFVMHFGKFTTDKARILALSGILAVVIFGFLSVQYWHIVAPTNNFLNQSILPIHLTSNGSGSKTSSPHGIDIYPCTPGTITIVDDGFFSHRPSPEKAVAYELKPYIVKKFGSVSIKELTINRPGKRNFETARAICSLFSVTKVKIILKHKKLTPLAQQCLTSLAKLLTERKVQVELFT